MRLEIKKENEEFVKIINKILTTLTQKEKNDIFNNYQLISYQKDFDFYM